MKNIAIVGSKPDTWKGCQNLDRRKWEIWRYSRKNYEQEPNATRWFELHHPRNYPRYETGKPGYTEFIKTATTWHEFPFAEMIDMFGPFFFHYGQAPWLLAYAISRGPAEIRLFGIEPGKEYGEQKKEVQHFMCIAQERGITISAPEDPALNTYAPLYAVERDWHGQAELLKKLRDRGVEPTNVQNAPQKVFTADEPRGDIMEMERRKQEARRAKYG
jgi:hypothetical protein